MTSKEVEQAIRALGLAVTRVNGKWRINYRGGKEATAYYTTNDDDALGMARAMEVLPLLDHCLPLGGGQYCGQALL